MAFTYQNSLISQLPIRPAPNSFRDPSSYNTDHQFSTHIYDYSLIALLPVILVGLLITTIFCVYRFRRWKHNKKQLAELNAFYEIVESSPCLASGKPYLIQHCKDVEKSECDRITRAVCVPTQSSIFFQPIPPKAKSVRCNSDVLKAVNASEVLFHFAQLPTIEKINNNNNKKSLHFIHRV
ncbi:uncharacterized protein CELE_M04B2.7 [Caenorhabditis elegans]|nr:Uncharacterized protein CELE_M04B2.7 [Caenorhabditis elegans]CBJ25092.1 Uncharacterized protein CELE_M04B2.7 [Caenorhabditis elegans]|eukprot:NP_001255561.1 Uncharacterized protein CELE_M04B2.7 [Caenorhabditis elegans]